MNNIPDKSIDMILADLPYGTTACKWDIIIPLNDYIEIEQTIRKKEKIVNMNLKDYILYSFKNNLHKSYEECVDYFNENKVIGLWTHYNRIIKDNGAIVLFGSEPFSNKLINTKPKQFKYYDLVWDKVSTTGFLNAKRQPLRKHEQIICFYKKQTTYNPIMEIRGKPRNKGSYNKKTR